MPFVISWEFAPTFLFQTQLCTIAVSKLWGSEVRLPAWHKIDFLRRLGWVILQWGLRARVDRKEQAAWNQLWWLSLARNCQWAWSVVKVAPDRGIYKGRFLRTCTSDCVTTDWLASKYILGLFIIIVHNKKLTIFMPWYLLSVPESLVRVSAVDV